MTFSTTLASINYPGGHVLFRAFFSLSLLVVRLNCTSAKFTITLLKLNLTKIKKVHTREGSFGRSDKNFCAAPGRSFICVKV